MESLFLHLVVLMVCTSFSEAERCFTNEANVGFTKDYQTIKNVGSSHECAALCGQDNICHAYTYITEQFPVESFKRNCNLQLSSFTQGALTMSWMVSGRPITCPAPFPSQYYGYYPNLVSAQGIKVAEVFRYIDIPEDQHIIITHVDIDNATLLVRIGNDWGDVYSFNATKEDRFRVQVRPSFSGVIEITFNLTSETSYTLIALTNPAEPHIELTTNVVNRSMIQGSKRCEGFTIDQYFVVTHPSNVTLPDYLNDSLASESLRNIRDYKRKVRENAQRYKPKVELEDADTPVGRWHYIQSDRDYNIRRHRSSLQNDPRNLQTNSKYCFIPHNRKSGTAPAVLSVGVFDSQTNSFVSTRRVLTLNANVANKNDRPTISKTTIQLPRPLPYNYSEITGAGFHVRDILTSNVVSDPDGDAIGMAIVQGKRSNIGYYEYKCSGGSWSEVNISNTRPLRWLDEIKVIYLSPGDEMRFTMARDDYWSRIETTRVASLNFLAWDMSNEKSCGEQTVNVTNAKQKEFLSEFESVATLTQLRIGCDGSPGTVGRFDACGVCQGDNSTCTDCAGVVNGKAFRDSCLQCSSGTTGLIADPLVDCAGTCNESRIDSCGVCQIYGFETPRDCNGDCLGTAVEGDCGYCVLGRTNKTANFGKDACGVCNGTSSTCLDCAGVPNGLKKIDLCGECLSPTHPQYNTGCGIQLGNFAPKIGYYGGMDVDIAATSVNDVTAVRCYFNDVEAVKSVLISPTGVRVTTPSNLQAGLYNITCNMPGLITSPTTARGQFRVLDMRKISIQSISLTVVNKNDPLSIYGRGFVRTSELKCYYGDLSRQMKTIFISDTEIKCVLPPEYTKIAKSEDVHLSFSSYKRDERFSDLSIRHYIAVPFPELKSARYSNTLNRLILRFTGFVNKRDDSVTLADLFPYNYTSFGTSAYYEFSARDLNVIMLGKPTITFGNLIINTEKIKSRAETTVYPEGVEASVPLRVPEDAKMPDVTIIGSTVVGSCDKIRLKIKLQGGNPGRLTYSWSARLADDETPLDSSMTALLSDLNAAFGTYSSETTDFVLKANESSFIYKKITYSVIMRNFLNMSRTASITILRENKKLPRAFLPAVTITSQVSRQIKVRVNAKAPSCLGESSTSKLTYQWELLPSAGIIIPNTISPLLVIPPKQLVGGRTYTATIVVAMQQDPSLSVTQTATITTVSSDVVAVISGVQTMSIRETLTLSGLSSYDPDGNAYNAPVSYRWQILNMDNSAVVSRTTGRRIKLDPTGRIYLKGNGNLDLGKSYKFKLVYRVGDRVNTAEHVVNVLACATCIPPSVQITTTQKVFNPSSSILIEAKVSSGLSATFTWSSEQVEGAGDKLYGHVDGGLTADKVLTAVTGTFVGTKDSCLKIKSGILRGGLYYKFKLKVVDRNGIGAANIYELKTNYIPTKGLFEVSPRVGEALNTNFQIRATSGWSDPDGDSLVFLFSYKTESDPSARYFSYSPQEDDSFNTQLPTGNLTIRVRCIDIYGGYSEAYQQVTVNPPTTVDLTALEDQLTTLADEQNTAQLIALASTFVSTLTSEGGELSEEQKDVQMAMTDLMCSNPDNVQTQEQKDELINGLASSTKGASSFSPESIQKILDMMRTLLNVQSQRGKRRRRRSATPSGLVVIKTPTEVETSLLVYDNLITPTWYDTASMNSKQELLTVLDSLTASMCKGLSAGEEPRVAKSKLIDITTEVKDTANIDTESVVLGLSNTYPSNEVVLGSSLQDRYASYACGDGGSETCNSICISSWMMHYDLLSTRSNSSMLSPVMSVKLWDPRNQAELTSSDTDLSSGMEVKIAGNPTNNSYLCLTWDDASHTWVNSDAVTIKIEKDASGTPFVTCNVTKMGFVALFEGLYVELNSITLPPTAIVMTTPPRSTSDQEPSGVDYKSAVSIECDSRKVAATVDPRKLKNMNIVSLSIGGCSRKDYNVTDYHITTTLEKCSYKVTQNHDFIVKETSLILTVGSNDTSSTIYRGSTLTYILRCQFERRINVTTGLINVKDKERVFIKNVKSNFTVEMVVHVNEFFNTRASFPLEVTNDEPVYISVKSFENQNFLKFIVEDCFATPTPDPQDSISHVFFRNKCAMDRTFKVYDQHNSIGKFCFKIDAFQFIQLKAQVFFHCRLLLCQRGSNTTQCTQRCAINDRQRRSLKDELVKEVYVNSGVIIFKRKATCGETRCQQHSTCYDLQPAACRCNEGYVYDYTTETCASTNSNGVFRTNLHIDEPFLPSYNSIPSNDFLRLARYVENELMMSYNLSYDVIKGVKMVGAKKGSIVLDLIVLYSSSKTSKEAFDYFVEKVVHVKTYGVPRLNIKRNISPLFVHNVFEESSSDHMLILSVAVPLVALVLFVLVVSAVVVRCYRGSAGANTKAFDNVAVAMDSLS